MSETYFSTAYLTLLKVTMRTLSTSNSSIIIIKKSSTLKQYHDIKQTKINISQHTLVLPHFLSFESRVAMYKFS